jgi:hypothetical protein
VLAPIGDREEAVQGEGVAVGSDDAEGSDAGCGCVPVPDYPNKHSVTHAQIKNRQN